MKVDGKALAAKYMSKTKDANIDAKEKSEQGYGDPDAKMSYHHECMAKFIEAVHSKEPQNAHAAMVDYARGEPKRGDSEGRDHAEEDRGAKPSFEEIAQGYRASQFKK